MRGPFLPIYGNGAIMMLVVSMPFQDNRAKAELSGIQKRLNALLAKEGEEVANRKDAIVGRVEGKAAEKKERRINACRGVLKRFLKNSPVFY